MKGLRLIISWLSCIVIGMFIMWLCCMAKIKCQRETIQGLHEVMEQAEHQWHKSFDDIAIHREE